MDWIEYDRFLVAGDIACGLASLTPAREWINRMRMHIRDIQTKGVFGNDTQRQEAAHYFRVESLALNLYT